MVLYRSEVKVEASKNHWEPWEPHNDRSTLFFFSHIFLSPVFSTVSYRLNFFPWLLSYSTALFLWPRFGLSPLLSFLEPSHGHYPQPLSPLQPGRHESVHLIQKWTDSSVVGGGAEALRRVMAPSNQTAPFWPVRHQHVNLTTAARPPSVWYKDSQASRLVRRNP